MPPPFAPTFLNNTYQIPSFNPGNLTKKKGLAAGLGQQYGVLQGLTQEEQGRRAPEFGALFPGYSGMLESGYSPEEQSAIEQGSLTPIRGAFNTARDLAANRVARTRNTAGYGSMLSSAAAEEARQTSEAGLRNKVLFANEKQRRKEAGLEGIARLYGVDTSFLNSLLGQQENVLGVGAGVESRRRGVLGTLSGIVGLGRQIAGGIVGGLRGDSVWPS